ncbi:MAG TPA: DUF4091 domain-containing protein [Planctomycetota bacterium]|jgi:hypothetical protein|nr:DUF4091 domain-containing protein [Planctomycetota bacterium]OQC21199.1 MAG: hypothetical protein BWX69_01176 [Planctomycetes bacterium ADurb.Bin069]HNR99124.1 DUF4091 domain-containing protein [Planctomycetota bacterium]HNU25839.1 DUF4091 domain-containing protein [Planctomycetota bacterium]HOE29781.1 DUF4091 domain-containing protein [Planctomycetota bacterium]
MLLAGLSGLVLLGAAGGNLLPNPAFDGTAEPWRASGGAAAYVSGDGRAAAGSLMVARGDGDTSAWACETEGVAPGGVYLFSFWAKELAAGGGGCIVAGPLGMNHDFNVGLEWTRREFLFPVAPSHRGGLRCRLGTWMKSAAVAFDDAALQPVTLFHRKAGGFVLGEGEEVSGRSYRFNAPFDSMFGAVSRPLADFACGYNTNRWCFDHDAWVRYRHELGGTPFAGARVSVQIGYHTGGTLLVEARGDGGAWERAGVLDKLGSAVFELPVGLFPARAVEVRLARGDRGAGALQVYSYGLEAELGADPGAGGRGRTDFLVLEERAEAVEAAVTSLGDLVPGGANEVTLQCRAPAGVSFALEYGRVGGERRVSREGARKGNAVALSYELAEAGDHELQIIARDAGRRVVYRARTSFSVAPLFGADFGWRVPAPAAPALGLWWCAAAEKVGRERPAPAREAPIRLEAAANEEEAFQLVLRPAADLKSVRVSFAAPAGAGVTTRVREVAYVAIVRPSDYSGCPGLWPDPLPEHVRPLDLAAGRNQPFWLSVRTGAEAAAGAVRLTARIEAEGGVRVEIPVDLQIFDFAVPADHSVTTAFGFNPRLTAEYHRVTGGEERRRLFDLYMRNFRDHRISPYDFAPYDPIEVKIIGAASEETDPAAVEVAVDFTAWDAQAAKYLDEYRFDSFRLHLRGLGSGTFHSRRYGTFGPYRQGTPGYRALMKKYASRVEDHLRAKGWLSKAYIYWFDEPEEKDYEFVKEGMAEIRAAAPGLARMLTEEPGPALAGSVDIWCPILDLGAPEAIKERIAAGERVWWYVCCGPRAPYLGLFIDHPATDLRVWLWLSWKYGVTGILVWESSYWTSPCAYPKERQDPWKDPMSYVSGYSFPPGHIGYWGNGDGRFIYPPREIEGPTLSGPVDSIRWEMLRDGLEDYEYLALLARRIEAARAKGIDTGAFAPLLAVPDEICADARTYTRSPAPILARRRAVARAIEALGALLGK